MSALRRSSRRVSAIVAAEHTSASSKAHGKVRSSVSRRLTRSALTARHHGPASVSGAQPKPAITVADPELAFAVLAPSTATNSDTLATQFGYFAGYCNPHVPTWVRSRAMESLFNYSRRPPKYNPRKGLKLYDLMLLWKRWRFGEFDRFDACDTGYTSWQAAIATLPEIRKHNVESFSETIRTWLRCWHLDTFFDWAVGWRNQYSQDIYFQRSTTVTEYEEFLEDPLPYDPKPKMTVNDNWLWDPEEYDEVDQIVGLYASIMLTGTEPPPPNRSGRPAKSRSTSVEPARSAPPTRRPSTDTPPPANLPVTPSPEPASCNNAPLGPTSSTFSDPAGMDLGTPMPALEHPEMPEMAPADQMLFDTMVNYDSLSPFAVNNAHLTIQHLRSTYLLPSMFGVPPQDLHDERCVRFYVYPRQRGSQPAGPAFTATLVLWSATIRVGNLPPELCHFRSELVDCLSGKPPMDVSDMSKYDLYPMSILFDLNLSLGINFEGVDSMSCDFLKSFLDAVRAQGGADQYAITDLTSYRER